MARKRTKKATEDTPIADETLIEDAKPVSPPEPIQQAPDIFDEQIALRQREKAEAVVKDVADSTRIDPDQPANGFASQHTPRANAVSEQRSSHAEAVGKRGPRYNDQGIVDKLAGAKLLEHHDPYLSIIRFEEKPSDAVRGMLRESGFRWEPDNKEWARSIRFETRQQDRIDAERVFEDVCKTIRQERGITHEFGGGA